MAGRKKLTPFAPWESARENGVEKRYIRMGVSQLLCPAALSLGHLAFRIYCYMKLEAGGKREFCFPRAKYRCLCSPGGFSSALFELERAGLIEVVFRGGPLRRKNVYRFSTLWRSAGLSQRAAGPNTGAKALI